MRTRAVVVTGLLLGFTATLALVFFALNRGVTLGFAKQTIEQIASARIGRAVTLQEAPYVQLGSELRLRVQGLRVANAPWASGPAFLTVGHADVRIGTRSLFSGITVVNRAEIRDTELALELADNGQSNAPELGEEPAGDAASESQSDDPTLLFDDLLISNLRVNRRNQRDGTNVAFIVTQLKKAPAPGGILLSGEGLLQDRPWILQLSGSAIRDFIDGKRVSWNLEGKIAELTFDAALGLPSKHRLADASLKARVSGSLPREITTLSPLLDADAPISLTATISDIDPGVAVEINADLPQLKLTLSGEIDEPGAGDGMNLSLSADAQSFPRLAAALNLGVTSDVPLSGRARLTRNGAAINLADLVISAGEHIVSGDGNFSAFPSTAAAHFKLEAQGPDFAFYQRLLQRPVGLPFPYKLTATLNGSADGIELLDTVLNIGDARAKISGRLGSFPSYRGSDLNLQLSGPSLQALGDSLALALPPEPYTLSGKVSVANDNRISLTQLEARTVGATLTLDGAVNGWPVLDELDANIELVVDSLAKSSSLFGIDSLGDTSGTISLLARGSLFEPTLSDVNIVASGFLASTRGSLRLSAGQINSDLVLDVAMEDLPTLLGDYAHSGLPSGPFQLTLAPTIDDELLSLQLRDFEGPGMRGNAQLVIDSGLKIDERTQLDMDIAFESLAELLPSIGGYTPADQPLSISAKTQFSGQLSTLNADIMSGDTPVLAAALTIPRNDPQSLSLHLEGEGPDLHSLGRLSFAPPAALPYRLSLDAQTSDSVWDIQVNRLSLAESEARGRISWSPAQRSLRADIHVSRANLDLWLLQRDAESESTAAGASVGTPARLIPDTSIPLNWLSEITSDVRLSTGPLGINDPVFRAESLVDSMQASLQSGDGAARLTITDMTGSRGELSATLGVQRLDDSRGAMLDADLTIDDFPLGIVSRARTIDDLPKHALSTSLRASGTTVRELASTLNGELLVVGGPGTLQDMTLSFATTSFLSQLFSTLLPGLETDSDMQVDCSVIAAQAKNGVVSLDPGLVLRTRRVDLTARGTIDLSDERLAVRFDNQARKGLGISAGSLVNPYVQITGTLAKPALGLDVASTAIAGGAAIATGGLTVLARPLYGRFLRRKNPCDTALKHWQDR